MVSFPWLFVFLPIALESTVTKPNGDSLFVAKEVLIMAEGGIENLGESADTRDEAAS